MQAIIPLPTAGDIHITPHGLQIRGTLDIQEWASLLRTLQTINGAYHCALADTLRYGRENFGDTQVATILEQEEFSFADVIKAQSIGQLTFDFRSARPLTSEHYFILSSKLTSTAEQEQWAETATREKLSPLELKRSIEAGRLLRTAEIEATSGQGTGINTIHGALFRIQQWQRSMGGTDRITALPPDQRSSLLQLLQPTLDLAAAIRDSLHPAA